MMVADTSALMAILLDEPAADACAAVLKAERDVLISAGTLSEAFVVAAGRDVTAGLDQLLNGLNLTVVALSSEGARKVGIAYSRWGRGLHKAGLNFGDCFAYALASERGCPLLYVGNDFAATDVESALA